MFSEVYYTEMALSDGDNCTKKWCWKKWTWRKRKDYHIYQQSIPNNQKKHKFHAWCDDIFINWTTKIMISLWISFCLEWNDALTLCFTASLTKATFDLNFNYEIRRDHRKISCERRAYESVDNGRLSWVYLKNRPLEFMRQGVNAFQTCFKINLKY